MGMPQLAWQAASPQEAVKRAVYPPGISGIKEAVDPLPLASVIPEEDVIDQA
jgi:hypothetical protein